MQADTYTVALFRISPDGSKLLASSSDRQLVNIVRKCLASQSRQTLQALDENPGLSIVPDPDPDEDGGLDAS